MKRIPIVILVTAFVTGALLFMGTCNTQPPKKKPDIKAIIEAKKKTGFIDRAYQKAFILIKAQSDSLENELLRTQRSLKNTSQRLKQSQRSLIELSKNDAGSLTVTGQMGNCDSLRAGVIAYLEIADSSRSIYETNISELQCLVATKDSQIVICHSSYSQLKDLMAENLQREMMLTKELQTAYKVQRRKVIQNKLLAGGFLILSGITTTLFLNSNK